MRDFGMKFSAVWDQLCRKHPGLSNDRSTIECTSANLRSLLRQVYDQGEKEGKEHAEKCGKSGLGGLFDLSMW